MKSSLVILLSVLLTVAFFTFPAVAEETPSALYVKKVENLPEDFIFGMDVMRRAAASAAATVISATPLRSANVPPPAACVSWSISITPTSGRIRASRWRPGPGKA